LAKGRADEELVACRDLLGVREIATLSDSGTTGIESESIIRVRRLDGSSRRFSLGFRFFLRCQGNEVVLMPGFSSAVICHWSNAKRSRASRTSKNWGDLRVVCLLNFVRARAECG